MGCFLWFYISFSAVNKQRKINLMETETTVTEKRLGKPILNNGIEHGISEIP